MAHVKWPDEVQELLDGDQALMLATVTPARGVVLAPLTNFGVHDREAATIELNSSVGMFRKLERIRRNPAVAVALHTRDHAFTRRPEYALLQGRATLTAPDPRYVETVREGWERFAGGYPRGGPLWQWWLRAWHLRVGIRIAVERVVVWPDLACRGEAVVHGPLLPEPAPPQRPPRGGIAPRVSARRAARVAARQPHVLLGWVGADGLPVAIPVQVGDAGDEGIRLRAAPGPMGGGGLVPPGGRRAGLTAHRFARYVIGQRQRIHTGWLEARGDELLYAPHTQSGYWFPRSPLAYKLAAGFGTRRGLRQARRAGFPLS